MVCCSHWNSKAKNTIQTQLPANTLTKLTKRHPLSTWDLQNISGSDSPVNSVMSECQSYSCLQSLPLLGAQTSWGREKAPERVLGERVPGSPQYCWVVAITALDSKLALEPGCSFRLSQTALLRGSSQAGHLPFSKCFPSSFCCFGHGPSMLGATSWGPGDGAGPIRFLGSYILHPSFHSP